MPPKRPLATPADVATFLSVPESTLKQWRYQGTGPKYTKVNSLVRYDWDDVEAFVNSGRPQAAVA